MSDVYTGSDYENERLAEEEREAERAVNRRAAEEAFGRLETQEKVAAAMEKLPPLEPDRYLGDVWILWASSALYEPGDVQAVYASEASAYAEVARRREAGDHDDFTVIPYEVKP